MKTKEPKVREVNVTSLMNALSTTGTAKLSDHFKPELKVYDYSEKAIAIVGDTKPIKAQLKALGGKYNPKLKCGAGWVFSKRKADEVKTALGLK